MIILSSFKHLFCCFEHFKVISKSQIEPKWSNQCSLKFSSLTNLIQTQLKPFYSEKKPTYMLNRNYTFFHFWRFLPTSWLIEALCLFDYGHFFLPTHYQNSMLIRNFRVVLYSGVLSLGVLVGAFLDQLTLSQPGGQIIPPQKKITTGTSGFSTFLWPWYQSNRMR